jgi:TrpR family transcriptional regulator, trp operon repressor
MTNQEEGWQGFVDMCFNCKNEETLQAMFSLFLTVEEKVDIARRFLIVRELIKADKTQRDIAKSLDVSIAKITRGSNEIKRLEQKWVDYLKKLYKNK